jgi:phthalate 4,5-cis-dihydrodiol dehydrogenase
MRAMIASDELGRLGMIASWNYTDYLYRPRRPEELDTAQGGGILFNQLPHQIDVVRLLGGGLVKSVRAHAGGLDPARPTEGHAVAFLAFQDGAAASLVYGGYDFFDSDELHGWISERGSVKQPSHGAARRALAARTREEAELRIANYAYGAADDGEPPHQPHFGLTIATCSRGELRGSANGVLLYGEDGRREIDLPHGPRFAGRGNVLDDLAAAIRAGQKPVHDGRWGKATLEVALAIQASAREGREVVLEHQVGV